MKWHLGLIPQKSKEWAPIAVDHRRLERHNSQRLPFVRNQECYYTLVYITYGVTNYKYTLFTEILSSGISKLKWNRNHPTECPSPSAVWQAISTVSKLDTPYPGTRKVYSKVKKVYPGIKKIYTVIKGRVNLPRDKSLSGDNGVTYLDVEVIPTYKFKPR